MIYIERNGNVTSYSVPLKSELLIQSILERLIDCVICEMYKTKIVTLAVDKEDCDGE
jgi:hypothetical protein